MAFSHDISNLVTAYQERIDWLINSAGKTITLHFKKVPIETIPQEDLQDPIRGPVVKSPIFKPGGQLEEYDTSTIKALVQQNPKDFARFNIQINDTENVVRLKTYMTYAPSLLKCHHITLPNQELVYTKYRLIREPTKHGLKDERYCLTYWERII